MRSFMGSFVRNSFCVALSIGLSMLVGCTDSTRSFGKLVPVKGTVTYNGKPVPAGCAITFIHSERGFPASAPIAADGTYTLLFNGKPEVPVGTYKVSVTSPAAGVAADPSSPDAYKAMMMKTPISKGGGPAKAATIPPKYATPETSGVTFSVVEGQATYDLDMKD